LPAAGADHGHRHPPGCGPQGRLRADRGTGLGAGDAGAVRRVDAGAGAASAGDRDRSPGRRPGRTVEGQVQAVTSYRRALDTFVIELDGVPRAVQKGAILPESDPVVQHDLKNGELLFAVLDTDADEPAPAKSAPAKAEPAPEKADRKSTRLNSSHT